MKLNAIIEKGENGWFVGQVEEMPAIISQGKTIEEFKANLIDALNLYLETQRDQTNRYFYTFLAKSQEILLLSFLEC
jgi:predicted RNase H-like HicB family nuclease